MARLPDQRQGAYHVTIRDGGRTAVALGPFRKHKRALGLIDAVRRYVQDRDPRGYWYAYGTSRLPLASGLPAGLLNTHLPAGVS